MTFGTGLFGVTPFGAAAGAAGPAGPEQYAPTAALRVICVAGQVVAARVELAVKVFEQYQPSAPLAVRVHGPRVAPVVPLRVSVFECYAPAVPLAVSVSAPVQAPAAGGSAVVWGARILLGGVDVSARITGQINVEAEEGAAAVAHFALAPAGQVVSMASWARKPVVIDLEYFDTAGLRIGLHRLFTGLVDSPDYDVDTRVTLFTCSDGRQAKIMGMHRGAIDALTPDAVWSPHVFDRYALAEQYLDDRVSTLAGSVEGDAWGALHYTPWAGVPTRSFHEDDVLDGSLRPRLAGASAARRARLSITYRRPQAVVRGIMFYYEAPSLGTQFATGCRALSRAAVEQALQGSGATVEAPIVWAPYPVRASIENRGYIITVGSVAESLCLGAATWLNRRYSRWISEGYEVLVGTEGTLSDESRTVAVQWDTSDNDNKRPPANAVTAFAVEQQEQPVPYIPPRTSQGETLVDYVPDGQPDAAGFALAYAAVLRSAARGVAESQRGSTISISVSIDPSITLRTYAAVATAPVSGSGKVRRVVHRLDIDAGSAVTDVELECVSAILPDVPAPVRPAVPHEIDPAGVRAEAGNYIGGLFDSPPHNEVTMWGYTSNGTTLTSPSAANRYPEQFSVRVPGIEERAQAGVTVPPLCTMTAGSTLLEALTSTDGFAYGVKISGAGIPAGAVIQSVDTSAKTAHISLPATITGVEREVRVATRQYVPRVRVSYHPTINRTGPFVGA